MGTVVVLAGGDPEPTPSVPLPAGAYVIAADSGLHLAQRLGLTVDLVVGDFDSVDEMALDAAVAAGTRVERHPEAKDATDLELALDAAVTRGAERIVVVGGGGGRLDHLLANALLLASPRFAAARIDGFVDGARVHVVHGSRPPVVLEGSPGDLVTLLPVGGTARGIVTEGLEYPLRSEDLPPGTSRGVSNVLLATTATVALAAGTLLVVQP